VLLELDMLVIKSDVVDVLLLLCITVVSARSVLVSGCDVDGGLDVAFCVADVVEAVDAGLAGALVSLCTVLVEED